VPFRLLAFVPDLESLPEIGGGAFTRYAERGVAVTVVCASGVETVAQTRQARRLGIQALLLLDYRPAERESPSLAALFADIIRAIQPHVVVVLGADEAIRAAGTRGFVSARQVAPGSGALPAKLYHRYPAGFAASTVTTAVPVGAGGSSGWEPFRRIFPRPWVTGVLERDLFAGLTDVTIAPPVRLDDRLAS